MTSPEKIAEAVVKLWQKKQTGIFEVDKVWLLKIIREAIQKRDRERKEK